MKRILALVLSFTMLFSCVAQPAAALAEAMSSDDFANALHFIVRHWHSDEVVEELNFQKGELEKNGDRYYVVVEGYIVPRAGGYAFYLVNQETDEPVLVEEDINSSGYIDSIDPQTGKIVLTANAVAESEQFSTFSISAGHSAVAYDEDAADSITITYDPEVHLVKSHVFYVREGSVTGTGEPKVSHGGHSVTDGEERDTAYVYTWKDGVEGQTAGDIVVDGEGKVYEQGDTLPDGLEQKVTLTKIYNTQAGLHTDKTASAVSGDGRTFNLDLEVWYVEGLLAQVGMVLDASGSMAFTTDEPAQIRLDADQIQKLGINKLSASGQSDEPDGGWGKYFLTQDQVDQILNKNHTDNSQLSASGYSYFVYDASDNTKEYAPIGYWEGVPKPPKEYEFKKNEEADPRTNWPDGHRDLNMGDAYGLYTSGKDGNSSKTGVLLDAKPESNAFTVSFSLHEGEGDVESSIRRIAELMYIGPMSGDSSADSYYRLIRDEGSSSARLRGNQKTGRGDWITDINNVFSENATHRVTLVFNNGTVTSYLDGSVGAQSENNEGVNAGTGYARFAEGEINIIINGIEDVYEGAPLYIDDIFVFNAALTEEEVKSTGNWENNPALIGLYKFENDKNNRPYPDDSTSRTWLLNSAPNANGAYASKLTRQELITENALSAPPTVAKTAEGKILGSINTNVSDGTASASLNHVDAGWYFITHSGSWDSHYDYERLYTGKRLIGIPGSKKTNANPCKFTDSITLSDGTSGKGTGYTYEASEDTPILFYVDEEGCLRCFYSRSNEQQTSLFCSYVYELKDSEYIKTESLQRALGSFVTDLKEVSPACEVSAVRFSTSDIDKGELGKLVLLDWTTDAGESAGILSLKRGGAGGSGEQGSANGYTTSTNNSIDQYNYGLTGSTSTQQGLQAFIDHLLPNDNDDAKKFLIIFTDGKDTDLTSLIPESARPAWNSADEEGYMEAYREKMTVQSGQSYQLEALNLVEKLKDEGYTIFTILLTGGPVKKGTQDYADAHVFLREMSGSKEDTSLEARDAYFFSVDSARAELEQGGDELLLAGEDILARIFTDKIIDMITHPLDTYTVMDYIDPRFDLVAKDGKVWHLNAGGNVVIGDGSGKDGTFTLTQEIEKEFPITSGSSSDTYTPLLRYNAERGLYYLEWTKQTILSSHQAAERLAIWKARVTVRAKDDFIGGNAVLTNGNLEHMNWVFSPNDQTPSSGTDRMNRFDEKNEELFDYPSKGFPRTTVNVKTPTGGKEIEEVIYMGETVLDVLFRNLIEELKATNPELAWYWEYLERYGAYNPGTSYAQLLDELCENNSLKIPYYYLPNEKHTNQPGTDDHMGDLIGYLTYTWDCDSTRLDTPTKTTEPIEGKLTVQYEPIETDERETLNNTKLIQEKKAGGGNVYQWDKEYKEAPGESGGYEGEFEVAVNIASGEIVLELVVPSGASNFLSTRMAGRTISYQVELWRTYGTLEEKVATLTAEYTVPSAMTGSDGIARVNAANYLLEPGYADYVKDHGLPIGTYTVRPAAVQNEGGGLYSFTPLEAVGGADNVYAQPEVFSVYGRHEFDEPQKAIRALLAPFTQGGSPVIALGTATAQRGKYTDQRYAVVRVMVEVSDEIPNVPATGDDSGTSMWFALMAFSALALIAMLCPRRKGLSA